MIQFEKPDFALEAECGLGTELSILLFVLAACSVLICKFESRLRLLILSKILHLILVCD